MSKEWGETGGEGRAAFSDGLEPIVCPNPKCGQELVDLDEDFWDSGPAEIRCRKCGEPAGHVGQIISDQRPGKCTYVFRCVPCDVKFTRRVPGMGRRCPNCKEVFRMFWNLLLGLPSRSSKRPLRKAALQTT